MAITDFLWNVLWAFLGFALLGIIIALFNKD